MDVEEGTSNGDGTECSEGLHCPKSDGIENGVRFGFGNSDAAGWSSGHSEGFQTYKRRKHTKSSAESKSEDCGRAFAKEDSQMVQQPLKEPQCTKPSEQVCLPMDCSDGCSQRSWKIVLEHMYQSLSDDEGGMQKCIRDVLQSCPEIDTEQRSKECDQPDTANWQRCNAPVQNFLNGFQKETRANPGVLPKNGYLDSISPHKTKEMCRHAWFNILISDKFSSLCKLLSENFQGIKTESFFDLKLMNSRMKDGFYDHSPMLFLTDIQQVWERIQGIGAEMVSLAKNLSDLSKSCYDNQFCNLGPDSHQKVEEQGEDYPYRACTCQRCGNKADGRDYLVCDSCEEMYHVSCIEPAVEGIPLKSWYCSSCTTTGIRLPHENCVVCEKLNAPKTAAARGVANDGSCTEDETLNDLGENSNSATDEVFRLSATNDGAGPCKICGSQIRDGEKSRTCGHAFCPSKSYHARCLTRKQLKSYGPCWYCPSCLCRACLIDKDDDDIILCDGCDHAYHIYCTEPQLIRVPTGKWFCRSCDAKLVALQSAKKAYERKQKKADERFGGFGGFGNKWNSKSCVEQDKGGGMEMLLTAVNTLNCEEKAGCWNVDQ